MSHTTERAAFATQHAEPKPSERGPRAQFREQIARMSYDEQVQALAPPMPAPLSGLAASPALQLTTGGGGGGATWEDYVNTLPAPVQAVARTVPTAQQEAFKSLSDSERATYAKFTEARARSRFITTAGKRAAMAVIAIDAGQLDFYQKLYHSKAVARDKFEVITPDERRDLLEITRKDAEDILGDETRMAEWNVARVSEEMKKNLPLAGKVVTNPSDEAVLRSELIALCEGQGGERMRRVIADPGFEVEQTKVDFIKDVRNTMTSSGAKSMDAMKTHQPNYILKGKVTTIDPTFDITKAIPLANIINYNSPTADLIQRICDKMKTHPDFPKVTRPAAGGGTEEVPDPLAHTRWNDIKGKLTLPYLQAGHPFDAVADMGPWSIRGGAPVAYWTYDKTVNSAMMTGFSLDELRKALAVEEDAAYTGGALVVQLGDVIKTKLQAVAGQEKIRRPTCIDGLTFDQFALEAGSKDYGVTSGGTGEVIVGSVPISDVTILRYTR